MQHVEGEGECVRLCVRLSGPLHRGAYCERRVPPLAALHMRACLSSSAGLLACPPTDIYTLMGIESSHPVVKRYRLKVRSGFKMWMGGVGTTSACTLPVNACKRERNHESCVLQVTIDEEVI